MIYSGHNIYNGKPADTTMCMCCCCRSPLQPVHNFINTHYSTLFLNSLIGSYESLFMLLILNLNNTYFKPSTNFIIVSIEIFFFFFVFSFVRFLFRNATFFRSYYRFSRMVGFLECSIFSNDGMVDSSIVRMSHIEMVEQSNYLFQNGRNTRIID